MCNLIGILDREFLCAGILIIPFNFIPKATIPDMTINAAGSLYWMGGSGIKNDFFS